MKKQIIKPEQGKRLKKCIEYANMTQLSLADEAHISQQHLSNIINGKAALTPDNAMIFSKILKVRLKYLLLESDYMTENERISAICNGTTLKNTSCYDLIESVGYKIIDMKENADGSRESMHRNYKQIIINSDDTPEQILERASFTPPTRVVILQKPSGERVSIEQEELLQIINNIADYAKFQCETLFHRFDPHFKK